MKPNGLSSKVGLSEAGFGLLLLSFLFYFLADREWQLLAHSRSQPQSITASKLSNQGPDGNWYVHITDFTLIEPMVSYAKNIWPLGDSMESLSCKMVAKQGVATNGNELILVKAVKTKAEIDAFLNQSTVDGFAEPGKNGIIKITARPRRTETEFACMFVLPFALTVCAGLGLILIGLLKRLKSRSV